MESEVQFLFQRYNQPVYNFFANRGFTREECRDLTQETFLELHRSMSKFRGEASSVTWVWSIAKNVWLRTVRDRGRAKRNAEMVSLDRLAEVGQLYSIEEKISDLSEQGEALEKVLSEERVRLLRSAIGELPEKTRACLLLHLIQSRKCWEIAAALQMSESAVKFHLSQAREKLKVILVQHFPESVI
jgi:RNA polymerase sigma-70 factor (ECF subfamily)